MVKVLDISGYQLIIINYHQLSSIIINYHQLSSIIINYHQLSSIIINYHQLSSIIINYRQYLTSLFTESPTIEPHPGTSSNPRDDTGIWQLTAAQRMDLTVPAAQKWQRMMKSEWRKPVVKSVNHVFFCIMYLPYQSYERHVRPISSYKYCIEM